MIAINDNYLVAPFADVCYFADARWWKWHTEGLAKSWPWKSFTKEEQIAAFRDFDGQKVTIENTGMMIADPEVAMLHNFGQLGLSEQPNGIHTGSNSGYQAINLAVLAGAKRILLLGYDMKFDKGRAHAHNGHPATTSECQYLSYAKSFSTMIPFLDRLGVEVVNCTPGSAIQAFKRGTVESLLPDPSSAVV